MDSGNTPDIRLAVAKTKREIQPIEGPGAFWLLISLFLILLSASIMFLNPSTDGTNPQPTPTATETPERAPRIYTVTYKAGFFSPTNLRIHTGDTVRFKNDHYLGMRIVSDPHPAHDDLPGLDSIGDIPAGGNFAFTFAETGIFGYHNEKNSQEAGTIIVR